MASTKQWVLQFITFEVNFMDSKMIPLFLSLDNFMISNVFMKFSANSAYLT